MPLEYPITKAYTIPHLTVSLSVVSVVAIAVLAALNVALQGYEVVSVLRPDPNVTESHWWSVGKVSVRSEGQCNPVSLSGESNFRTNSSLFSYSLRSTFDANYEGIVGTTSYMANPLDSCAAIGIKASMEPAHGMYTLEIPILCTGSDLPFALSLTSKLSLNQVNQYYDDISNYYVMTNPTRAGIESGLQVIPRNASSSSNIIGILDAITTDMRAAVSLVVAVSKDPIPTLLWTGGVLACPGGQNATCGREEMRMTIPKSVTYYPNGTAVNVQGPGPFLAPIERSIINAFIALQDAYHIDFGNIQPSNIYLSDEAFAALIQPDPILSKATRASPETQICSWGAGCVQGSTWVEQLLASDPNINATIPSILPSGNASAVVKVDYLCPQLRLKSRGSLVASVFIGTWSMYMALYGVFQFVGPMLEKRYARRHRSEIGYELAQHSKYSA